jgi:hypothetical protein
VKESKAKKKQATSLKITVVLHHPPAALLTFSADMDAFCTETARSGPQEHSLNVKKKVTF